LVGAGQNGSRHCKQVREGNSLHLQLGLCGEFQVPFFVHLEIGCDMMRIGDVGSQ